MACPGLVNHTLPGLCALWLPSGTSTSGILLHSAKPHPLHMTCPAWPQHPVQAPPAHLLPAAEAAFDLAVYPMACPGLATHTLVGLCALWLPSAASSSGHLHKPAKPQHPQTTGPALPQPQAQAPPNLPHTPEASFDLAMGHGMCRAGQSHTGRALCAVVGKRHLHIRNTPAFSKTAPPTHHLPSLAAASSAGSSSTPAAGC